MPANGWLVRTSLVRFGVPAALMALLTVAPTTVGAGAAHADTNYGGGCVLYSNNPLATVDSIRHHCTDAQQDQIYNGARPGNVPSGLTDGWVARPPFIQAIAPAFWVGKTFYTGPKGGTLTNRITPQSIPGWPANVYVGPGRMDGHPAWLIDYAPSITPQILDEIREVSPGVWLGYSWWRGFFQTPQLLNFVLVEH
ncbi:hypothetical protein [Nocardia alni]|uniref:hypothetical protein n=1 Tax=Nocardia alni TaxID=2815723 RepID=UPI001C22AEAB|nr:hypothetical protein [Nocardia alni]